MAITAYTSTMAVWAATDAGFRTWGKAWTDMLDTMGLTQVYSNIDWTTVTMPVTASPTWAGSRVYKFDDVVSGTREVYVKVEFGRTSTSAAGLGFGIKVTVGVTHDGSGGVTGYSMSHYFPMTQAPADGGDIIGVRSDIGFSIWTNISAGTAYQAGFAVERLAEDGVATADGAVMMLCGASVDGTSVYAMSPVFHTANYAGGQVFPSVGVQTSYNSDLVFRNFQTIPATSDPSYAGKAPAITVDTFGKYDCCYHWIIVSKYMYSPATEFAATINGVAGTYRTPYTGFLADNGSTSYNRTYLAFKVA